MTLSKDIQYKVKISEQDCLEPFVALSAMRHCLTMAAFCMAVLPLAFVPGNPNKDHCIAIGCCGLVFLFWRFVYIRLHIRSLLKTPMYLQEHTHSLSDSEFKIHGEYFSIAATWSQFVKWGESKTAICIFTSPTQFYLLPHRCFSDPNDLASLREHLKATTGAKLVERAGGFFLALFIAIAVYTAGISTLTVMLTKFGTRSMPSVIRVPSSFLN
ncbi:MAG: hypothetical protein DKT66_14015 [Candidatus Melainabacteria bacterium]|nr:MAG: hypothetical protein DKT66_14015 [Candidatus Melainabacteria bacterium]